MKQNITAILMAAGFSQRMGRDKLFLSFKGKTLIGHAIYLLNQLPVSEKIIITTEKRLERLALPPGIRAIINESPQRGKSESVRQGVWAANGEWYLFLNADQPKLNTSAIIPMLELTENTSSKIIYPVVNGKPGSPTLFHRDFRAALLTITGDEGGKTLRDSSVWACHPYTVEKPELFADVDTPQDAKTIT
jgi:molybdenum cofactor cytidylyltransferase